MMLTEKQLETFIDLVKFRNAENQFQRIPFEAETDLLNKIRQGDYENILISPFSRMDENLGPIALDKKTGYTYLTVTAIALFSRTVIDCGVTPDEAFDLSDALLFALSGCNGVDEIHNIFQLSATMFAKQVARLRITPHSHQIERICNYIGRNIFQKITLEDIAAYTELTDTYLCRLFAKEMGISIHSYIQREKITVACNLFGAHRPPYLRNFSLSGFQEPEQFCVHFQKMAEYDAYGISGQKLPGSILTHLPINLRLC